MRPYPVLAAALLVLCLASQVLPAVGGDGIPCRNGTVDLYPVLNHPLEGGKYLSDNGFVANVTVHNAGSVDMTDQGQLAMVVLSYSSGEIVFSAISRTITGIASGGHSTYQMQNWTGASPGKYICNVSVQYPPDSDRDNNYAESVFTLYTDFWPYPPRLDSWTVSPAKGNTTTTFVYTIDYIHNVLPMAMFIEMDGSNRTMVETDPGDDSAQDGKEYRYSTTLPIGNHEYRFFCHVNSTKTIWSDMTQGPWVNISFRNPYVYPDYGFVTTDFRFSVEYGSTQNLPPDDIYLMAGTREFDLVRTTPTPNYLKGDVRFEVTVKGMDLIPSPVNYSFRCRTAADEYALGPFQMDGPDMRTAVLTGTVKDLDGNPLMNATVSLSPGGSTRAGPDGGYALETYLGSQFLVTYSMEGFITRSYLIDVMADRRLDIALDPIPSGGTVTGRVTFILDGEVLPVTGAVVNLTTGKGPHLTLTDSYGNYSFGEVDAGSAHMIKVTEHRFFPHTGTLKVLDGKVTIYNVSMTERPMDVSVFPDPSGGPVSVGTAFSLRFTRPFQMPTVSVSLRNSTDGLDVSSQQASNSTLLVVSPVSLLNFDEVLDLSIQAGVLDLEGRPLVWRSMTWSYNVERQGPGMFVSEPTADMSGVPLDINISFSFGIALKHSTIRMALKDLDRSVEVPLAGATVIDTVNWSDSGRTDTLVKVRPAPLNHSTRYSFQLLSGLQDVFGRALLSEMLSVEFRTVDENDRDGDGVPDSQDPFPDDPTEWSDGDGDGHGDNLADRFPGDPDEWRDTDGDGTGDNSDDDDDNDGMPDAWETANGFDPLDPTDAFLDKDADGISNLKEYLAGTDPNDKDDRPSSASGEWKSIIVLVGLLVLILLVVAGGAAFVLTRSREGRGHPGSMEE